MRFFLFPATVIATALAACPTGLVCADIVRLKSGGEIKGELLDDREDSDSLQVKLLSGGQISIPQSEVEEVLEETGLKRKYSHRARNAPDTVAAHLELAKWCRENQLRSEGNLHLDRILQLDPNHIEARTLLGYRSNNGDWITREEIMASRGLVVFQGEYRTLQEIELLKKEGQHKEEAGGWRNQLHRWYRRLSDRQFKDVAEARNNFLAIRDPDAAEPVAKLLRREGNFETKLLFLEVLSQLDARKAVDSMVWHSLYDPVEEIRNQSLDYLIDSKRSNIAHSFIRALSSKDNVIINRAARALQEIGDKSAIQPLIAALVTNHTIVHGNTSGGDRYAVSPSSGVSSFGGGGPRVEKLQLENPAVLSALVKLSDGQSFGYDGRLWREWLVATTANHQVDLRRDQ